MDLLISYETARGVGRLLLLAPGLEPTLFEVLPGLVARLESLCHEACGS